MDAIVRVLRADEIRRASFLLADAFAADPFIGYSFRARRRRRLALPPFFRAVLHELADAGSLFAVEANGGALVGVAAWKPRRRDRQAFAHAGGPGLQRFRYARCSHAQRRGCLPASPRLLRAIRHGRTGISHLSESIHTARARVSAACS